MGARVHQRRQAARAVSVRQPAVRCRQDDGRLDDGAIVARGVLPAFDDSSSMTLEDDEHEDYICMF